MTPLATTERYKNHRFPGEIISHGVWLSSRFPLSDRDVQELLLARGIDVTHEAIRQWCLKCGQDYANQLKRGRAQPGDKWHLDEVFLTINGQRHYLWRAVDQDDTVLDIPHSTEFSGGVWYRFSKASRREDVQVEQPVACWDFSSCDFHPTLSGMLSASLVGHQVVQMGQPAQKRLLAPLGVMKAFHGKQFPLDSIMRLIQQGAGHRHLGVCEDRRPARLSG
jgi:DDE domain